MSKLLEMIKNKKSAIAAKSGRERPLKLASAKNMVRLLPSWTGEEDGAFSQDFGQHFIKDKAGNVLAVYVCTLATFGKPCDICAAVAQYSASNTDEAVAKALSEARPSSVILVNAVYMNGTHANAKTDPVLLQIPVGVFNDILSIMETYYEDHEINIMDLKEGYDLVIGKTGAGLETRYNVTPSPKPRAIDASVMSKARNLADYANQEYAEGLQKALSSLGTVASGLAAPTAASSAPRLTADNDKPSVAQTLAETAPVDMDVIDVDFADVTNAAVDDNAPFADELSELDALMAELG